MVYELRIYRIIPGRMEAILNRFRDKTLKLFEKHGMRTTEFWIDADENKNALYYVLEHKDMESRMANFAAFQDDPEWLELKRITEQAGPLYESIEEIFMKKAPFFETTRS